MFFIFQILVNGSVLQGNACQHSLKKGHHATDHVSGLFGRLLYSHHHGPSQDERSVAHHTVNLLTSTIKVDAEQTDLRFCFTIVSPRKKYTLQVCCLIYAVKTIFELKPHKQQLDTFFMSLIVSLDCVLPNAGREYNGSYGLD